MYAYIIFVTDNQLKKGGDAEASPPFIGNPSGFCNPGGYKSVSRPPG